MKYILYILAFVLTIGSLFATTRNVVNPGNNVDIRANFLTQLTAAVDGDIIVLPAGTFIMSNMTTVNKDVTVIGSGIGVTTLYRDNAVSDATLEAWYAMFYCTDTGITFDGISFIGKTPSAYDDGHDGLSIAIDKGIEFEYGSTGLKVSNCRFENFGNSAVAVFHEDAVASGIITGNQFYHNAKGATGLGYGYGVTVFGRAASWILNPQLGSGNFIFIENNTFEIHRHAVASAGGSLMVVRYNTFLNNLMNHCIDTHSARGPGNGVNSLGSRATEIYNNTIINNKFVNGSTLESGAAISNITTNAIACRAGDMLVFNNTISGYRFGIGIGLWDVSPAGAYPYLSQPGYLSGSSYGITQTGNVGFNKRGKHVAATTTYSNYGDGDLYYWNNTFTPYVAVPSASSQAVYNYNPSSGGVYYFIAERDFHGIMKPSYKPYIYPHP